MVRAILAGTKTQTRRAMKPQPPADTYTVGTYHHPDPRSRFWAWTNSTTRPECAILSDWCQPCPYGEPGDRLWVRETWSSNYGNEGGHLYRADHGGASGYFQTCLKTGVWTHYTEKWRPSIHMPRAASRITLEITRVRVERLQAISREDALAEGIVRLKDGGYGLPAGEHYHSEDPRQSFFSLWEAINGPGSVEANPWLWALQFPKWEAARG